MAVAKMQKIQILVHRDEQERLVERIQELEQLHITDVIAGVTAEGHPDLLSGGEVSDENLEQRISQIQFTLDFLSGVQQRKGLLSGLVSPKIILTPQQYHGVAEGYDENPTVSRCKELDREKNELLTAITKLETIAHQLSPWLTLDCPLEEVVATEHTAIFLGTMPVESMEDFHQGSYEMADQIFVKAVHHDPEVTYLMIGCHRDVLPQISDLLRHLGFEEVTFPGLRGRPREVYEQTLTKIEEKLRRIQEIEVTSREYLRERQNLQILCDHLSSQLRCERIQTNFGRTATVSVIEGWIPKARLKAFETTLTREFEDVAIVPLDPSAQEAPPVCLENSENLVRPFEVVTELYGMPHAREFDPSPFLAPFFFVFFGLCITDAAYGIIITLLFLYLMKKFKFTLGRAKLIGLLFFGGISTILMGALTGGWFGDLVDYLPEWLEGLRWMRQTLMLFDPMEQVLIFIGIALILGFIQICYGLFIRMTREIRQGNLTEAFFGPFPWIILLNGLVIFGLSKEGVLPPLAGSGGKWMSVSSALAIVLLTDRKSSSWFARIAWGVYGLYGITSYVGDILSYLRLFA
ncbi:MAG: hypothetical protein GTN74_03175, partial [Proteobacteria bacterium]|nr:hypothetical protein [Pseudomonadota bacterium]NIS68220.1 hypothetical protein [Pseudomonadota bacterium]